MSTGLSAQPPDFKVVGYLPYYRFDLADRIEFERITHLNLAFANPDMSGELNVAGRDIRPIVERARQFDLTICISLAGGALTAEWAAAWEHLLLPQNRSGFIHKILNFVRAYDLDGVDVDLEWSHVNEKYSPFVLELRDSLKAYDKLMTAALPGLYRYPQITGAALESFDWINMMVYDLTGPWDPRRPGPHAPYSFALEAIDYWRSQGAGSEKLTLGLPFYGYDFGTSPAAAFTYASLVAQNAQWAYQDQVGQAYYNGIPTIEAKTELALAGLSGVMIWELGQDDFGDLSLLRAIDEIVRGATPVRNMQTDYALRIYPNPVGDIVYVQNQGILPLQLELTDMQGRPVGRRRVEGRSTSALEAAGLPAGLYVLSVRGERGIWAFKLVK